MPEDTKFPAGETSVKSNCVPYTPVSIPGVAPQPWQPANPYQGGAGVAVGTTYQVNAPAPVQLSREALRDLTDIYDLLEAAGFQAKPEYLAVERGGPSGTLGQVTATLRERQKGTEYGKLIGTAHQVKAILRRLELDRPRSAREG